MLQLGIGLASYVEITAADAAAGETARLAVHGDGTATVYTGSSAHGQGHHTAWAMLSNTMVEGGGKGTTGPRAVLASVVSFSAGRERGAGGRGLCRRRR